MMFQILSLFMVRFCCSAFLISISLFDLISAGPVCMQCTDAAEISQCITTQCGDNEQCYLEKSTTKTLTISYNAGCRSNTVCNMMAALNVGRKRTMIICNVCCGDAPDQYGPCNAKLCGLHPNALQDTCYVCSGTHSDMESCTTVSTCPPNEVCFTGIRIVGTLIRYVFGCYEERVCRAIANNDNKNGTVHHQHTRLIPGDQGVRICDACCKGNKCNSADCFQLRKNMTVAEFSSEGILQSPT